MEFTPTQQRILDVLSDGQPHTKVELQTCLSDELASKDAVSFHLSNIRQVINPMGQNIVCVYRHRRLFYQHVRLLASANDGKT